MVRAVVARAREGEDYSVTARAAILSVVGGVAAHPDAGAHRAPQVLDYGDDI